MKRNRFYKTSPHGGVGSSVSFHGINSGYVTDLDKARVYTLEEAQEDVDHGRLRSCNDDELFLSSDHVEELTTKRVDHQYVKLHYPESKDPNDEYVAYRKRVWDGNDLGFAISFKHDYSYDYSFAKVFCENELKNLSAELWEIAPKSHIDNVARRTFQSCNINRRKMISSAGIKGIRQSRKREPSGKVRMNCTFCGKIAWQLNPYEFESCSDTYCEGYRPSILSEE